MTGKRKVYTANLSTLMDIVRLTQPPTLSHCVVNTDAFIAVEEIRQGMVFADLRF